MPRVWRLANFMIFLEDGQSLTSGLASRSIGTGGLIFEGYGWWNLPSAISPVTRNEKVPLEAPARRQQNGLPQKNHRDTGSERRIGTIRGRTRWTRFTTSVVLCSVRVSFCVQFAPNRFRCLRGFCRLCEKNTKSITVVECRGPESAKSCRVMTI